MTRTGRKALAKGFLNAIRGNPPKFPQQNIIWKKQEVHLLVPVNNLKVRLSNIHPFYLLSSSNMAIKNNVKYAGQRYLSEDMIYMSKYPMASITEKYRYKYARYIYILSIKLDWH